MDYLSSTPSTVCATSFKAQVSLQSSLFNNHCQAELRNSPLLFLQPFEHTITPHFTLLKTFVSSTELCKLYENMCYFLILQTYISTYSPPSFSSLLYLLQIFKNEQLKHCLPPPPRGNFYPILGICHSHAGLYTFVTHICMNYSVTCFQHYLP